MPNEDEMSIDERRKYLKRMKVRYEKGNRKQRSALLSEMEQVTGLHRKSLTRLLAEASLERKKRGTARGRSYGVEVEEVIVRVWESLDYVCAERLTPVLLSTGRHLAKFGEVQLSPGIEEQLGRISRASVSRMLSRWRSRRRRLPQKGAERANAATKGVPMKRIDWQTQEPGHFEVDLVHHSGETTVGEYVHTLQMVDVATGWSERVAVMGRGYRAMQAGIEHILSRLPFAVQEVHPDNGSEFFNQHLVRFWKDKVVGVQLSRSRPYQKNDNRIVEQKNDTLVRQYFGDLRLDTPEQLEEMNALYEQMWLYYNFFQPVLHLKEKTVVGEQVRRKWDQAQTPYQRLIATGTLSPQQQQELQALYERTNPRHLREEIYRQLTHLWEQGLPQAQSAA
ncbi:MAG TPA: transposase family protein [Ktedonobacteraceae bacterium]|nr:transposase family protein [Ktedonobacteraceae bacterium]